MKDAPRWGVWRAMSRDGKPTKVPYSVVTGKMARANVLEDWTTFEAAVAFNESSPLFSGLGFLLGDGWAGVDLDSSFDPETGAVAAEAEAIIERFNTYTELSPSGTGFKLFMHGHLMEGSKGNRRAAPWSAPGAEHGDIEAYDSGRYFTVTGDAWLDVPVAECTQALQELQQRYFAPKVPNAPVNGHNGRTAQPEGDDDVLQRMFRAQNGGKVRALFNGDTSNYGSVSEADSALAFHLVWGTNRDKGMVMRLLRRSALWDEKWEREDYQALTVGKAFELVQGGYTPHQRNGTAERPPAAPTVTVEARPDFWQARPELERLFQFSLAHRAGPWGVLGCVLARVIASTPYTIVLPDIIGGVASLNLFVGLVAPSGHGKGACERTAKQFLDTGNYSAFVEHRPGSGQGLAHAYAHREKEKTAEGKTVPGGGTTLKRDASSVLFRLDEVDTLKGLTGQSSSTLMPELRSLAMGERLGHMYVDPEKRVEVEEHTYRAALIVGIQPDHADVLLNDVSGGTPQRFLWLPATYSDHPDTRPESPGPIPWTRIELPYGVTRQWALPVWEGAVKAIDQAHLARSRGGGEALDGHLLLVREKVAASLGFLNGRLNISQEDWELAGTVMDISAATRAYCVQAVADSYEDKERANERRKVREHAAIDEDTAKRSFIAAQRQVISHVGRGKCDGGCNRTCMRSAIAGRHKGALSMDELLADAIARGMLAENEDGRFSVPTETK